MNDEGPRRGVPWKVIGGILSALAALAAIITFFQHEFQASASNQHPTTSASPTVTSPSLSPTHDASRPQAPPSTPSPTATYQRVPFTVLCNASGVSTNGLNGCGAPIVDQVGDHVETWAATADATIQSEPPVMTFPETTCRSLVLTVGFNAKLDAPGGGEVDPGLRITVTVTQSGSATPKSITAKSDEVDTLFVTLNGGPWSISTTANEPTGGSWNIYLNGYASCTNSTGVS